MTCICRVLLLTLVCAVCIGCGSVGSTTHQAIQKNAAVPVGSTVTGSGFSVRAPVPGLHVIHDQPKPGFLSLRGSSPKDGAYNVYPFTSKEVRVASSDIWTDYTFSQYSENVAAFHMMAEHMGTWNKHDASFDTVFSRQYSSGRGAVHSTCLIYHGTKWYWIVRSVPVFDEQPENIQHTRAQVERELPPFLNSLTFADTTAGSRKPMMTFPKD